MLECKLSEEFPDSNFKVICSDEEIEVLYSNRDYLNDSSFLDEVLDLASEFLDENEILKLVTTYDLNNEIIGFDFDDALVGLNNLEDASNFRLIEVISKEIEVKFKENNSLTELTLNLDLFCRDANILPRSCNYKGCLYVLREEFKSGGFKISIKDKVFIKIEKEKDSNFFSKLFS